MVVRLCLIFEENRVGLGVSGIRTPLLSSPLHIRFKFKVNLSLIEWCDGRDVLKAWLSWWIRHGVEKFHLGLDLNEPPMEGE